MRQDQPHRSGSTRITYAVLSLAFILTATSPCTAQASALGRAGNGTAIDRSVAGRDRICNPEPEATLEDMRLAMAVLRDTTEMANWRNVAWYLGELGFSECFEPLRSFVWGKHAHGDPMSYMFDAVSSAQGSIGYVASSYPPALHYLIQSTDPAFWKFLPWRDSRMTGPELRLAMSEASIKALGMSGAPEAEQMLARLRQSPYRESQRSTIEEAIRTHHRVLLQRRYSPTALREFSLLHLPEILPATSDSSIIGAWRWMRSGGSSGAYHTPPVCGWSRTLFLERDSSYSFWEEDSVGEYPICSGRFIVHTGGGHSKGPWIEFRNWAWGGSGTFWPRFMGPDVLKLSLGDAEGVWHDLGATHTFVREREGIAPPSTIGFKRWRPPRISRFTPSSYYVELPEPLERALASVRVREWDLSHSRALVPRDYQYTHYQIPSGVIGDFDGDSLADAAIFGYDEENRNEVICLLSNHGSPRGTLAWRDPIPAEQQRHPSRPSYYLELCPSGRPVLDSTGVRTILVTDGIYRVSISGERSIIHYMNGAFHRGMPALGAPKN